MQKLILVLALSIAPLAGAAAFPEWMTGSWSATAGGVAMEEHWTTAQGDLMLGMHRDAQPSKRTWFEFLRIEKHDDGIYYMAMPGGRPATPFKMTAQERARVVFENPEHDFPKRIIYWQPSKNRLCARVEGNGNEPEKAEEYCWKRMN
ncbi:MAG: DUF6265 family protein [Thermoanaerobaculia bacterium]